MANMSIRGLSEQALKQLKNQAEREGSSLNSLVLHLLQGSPRSALDALQRFDDLDALAGTWSADDARAFERQTAAFADVDATLWQ